LATLEDMQRVKTGEFRDRASELIRRAAGGETVIILNRDEPRVKGEQTNAGARPDGFHREGTRDANGSR
jgi:hypothetical protein